MSLSSLIARIIRIIYRYVFNHVFLMHRVHHFALMRRKHFTILHIRKTSENFCILRAINKCTLSLTGKSLILSLLLLIIRLSKLVRDDRGGERGCIAQHVRYHRGRRKKKNTIGRRPIAAEKMRKVAQIAWRKRISSTVFRTAANGRPLHNRTQSAGRRKPARYATESSRERSRAPSRWSRLNIAEWSPE